MLILEDWAYGMIRWKQAVDNFPDWGLTFGNPDFVKYAEAYGARAGGSRRHRGPGADAGARPSRRAGSTSSTVPIDYSENTRVLIEELGNRAPELEPAE